MPNNGDLLKCLQDAEADLDSGTEESSRRVWRKVGVHLIRVHDEVAALQKSVDSVATCISEFRVAVFNPESGIIVKQNLALSRARWTIVVISAIAAVITFALGSLVALMRILGKG
jgi:hypothetical protein